MPNEGQAYKLTAAVIERVEEAAGIGANVNTLAQVAMVSRETFARWLTDGRRERAAGEESPRTELLDAIDRGHGKNARSRLEIVNKAGDDGDYKAAVWILETVHGYAKGGSGAPDGNEPTTAAPATREELVERLASLPDDVLAEAQARRAAR